MKRAALGLTVLLYAGNTMAFGMMDVFSAGVNAATKLGGAAIDKAMADSPEEAAAKQAKEKAQRDEQFKSEVAKVEADKNLTPLQKERMVRQIAKSFTTVETVANLQAQQEEARRQQRDQTLSLSGAAGVAGNAIMSTPSMSMARADMAVKAGVPQQQSRDTLAKTDALLNSDQVKANGVTGIKAAQASGAAGTPGVMDTIGTTLNPPQTQGQSPEQVNGQVVAAQAKVVAAKDAATASVNKNIAPTETNFLAQDKGRKIFVEFVHGVQYTEQLTLAFKNEGYTVVPSAKDADVVYQFDGEFSIDSATQRQGFSAQLGELKDTPRVIELPKKEVSVFRGAALGLVSLTGLNGGAVPAGSQDLYKQQVLVVANRSFEGKDTRTSVLVTDSASGLVSDKLIQAAMMGILSNVGLAKPQMVASANPNQVAPANN